MTTKNILQPNLFNLSINIDTNIENGKSETSENVEKDNTNTTKEITFTSKMLYDAGKKSGFSGNLLFSRDADYGSKTKVSEFLNSLSYSDCVKFFFDNKKFKEIYANNGEQSGERLSIVDNDIVVKRIHSNILNTMEKIFPTKYPYLNLIEDSISTNNVPEITLKNVIPVSIGKYLYNIPNNYYSYLKIDGKIYTITHVLWLNTLNTHPIYRNFIINHVNFMNWKNIASENIPIEISKTKEVFKKTINDEIKRITKTPILFNITQDIVNNLTSYFVISAPISIKNYSNTDSSGNIKDLLNGICGSIQNMTQLYSAENKKLIYTKINCSKYNSGTNIHQYLYNKDFIIETTFFTFKQIYDVAKLQITSKDSMIEASLKVSKKSLVEQIIEFNYLFYEYEKDNKFFDEIIACIKDIFVLYEQLETYIRTILSEKINILKKATGNTMLLMKIKDMYLDNTNLANIIDADVNTLLTTGPYMQYSEYLTNVKKICSPALVSMNTRLQTTIDDYSKGLLSISEFENVLFENNGKQNDVSVSLIDGKEYKIFLQMDFIGGEINDATEIDNCYYRDNLLEADGRNLSKHKSKDVDINRFRYFLDMDEYIKNKKSSTTDAVNKISGGQIVRNRKMRKSNKKKHRSFNQTMRRK